MKTTTRISKEEIRDQAAAITGALCASDLTPMSREHLVSLVREELERIANHAFSEGRLFERRNPVTP